MAGDPGLNSTTNAEALRELAPRMRDLRDRVVAEIGKVVVGMEDVTHQFLIALLAGGHVLLEGVPGVAKTTLSKTFAHVLGTQYQRLQFTPDLLPSDVTGTYIFDRKQNEFVLRKGPIFCQVLLADEVNRAPAKTQSALLEAMQENQVTIEGTTLPLPQPFMVLATQNPIEHEGVYRLPEAQLDRFLLRVEMGYPRRRDEMAMLRLYSHPVAATEQLFTAEQILDIQWQVANVHGEDTLLEYIIDLAEASREHPDLTLGASPRAALCLLRCARARAMLDGRHYFTHEDVQDVAPGVLGHRLIVRPEAEVEGKHALDVVRELLDTVPVLETGPRKMQR
ncbi:MAG TPA: MoxR family ATPase [Gemmataceae bacterium]|nr:MoxR family ATPase [Gemmataceae bacterium]